MDQILLPGFRFYPTEEELIGFYLHKKLHCQTPEFDRVIPSIDIYNFEPSQLPELAGQICHGDTEQWFFFMTQREREARGGRPTRTTTTGYWKATGSPSYVYSSETKVIGVKKTMVFYMGKAPTGRKTKWKMNEYKAIKQDDTNVVNTNIASSSSSSIIIPKLRDELSLCRIYVTSGCARAFDRRPPGITTTTTTTTLNNITSTQLIDNIITSTRDDYNNHNNVQVIGNQESNSGPGGSQAAINRPNVGLLSEKSISSSDSPKSKGHDLGTLLDVEGISNCNYDDIEMTDSLDDTFIDWEQLGCL